MLTEQTMTL